MNFKILSMPGQSPATPTPGSLPSAPTPPQQNYKILSAAPAPAAPVIPQAPDPYGGVTNPLGKGVIAFGNAAQDTTNALTGNSGTVLDKVNPIGWASKLFGGAANLVGEGVDKLADVTTKPLGAAIGSTIRSAVGGDKIDAALNSPVAQSLKTTITSPDVQQGLGAVGKVAGLAGTVAGLGEGAKAFGNIGETTAPLAQNLQANATGQAALEAPAKIPGVVGKITQATGSEIPTATRALSSIETGGVQSFDDLSSKIQEKIDANTKTVDSSLGKSTDKFTPDKIDKQIPVQGGEPITSNPVKDGLKQLENFYEKTNSPSDLARIKTLEAKYQSEGLTPKDINGIAREHGRVLNGYNANGELASGLTKQAAENTRSGIKGVVDQVAPDAGRKAVDANTADLIKTKGLVDDLGEKVQTLENKLKSFTPLQKAGQIAAKGFDLATGGAVKGFLRQLMGIGMEEGKTMNAVQLQEQLPRLLRQLDDLNSLTPKQAIAQIKTMLALPAPGDLSGPNAKVYTPIIPQAPTTFEQPAYPNNYQPRQQLSLPAPQSTLPQVSPTPIRLPGALGTVGDPYHQSPAGNYPPLFTPPGPPLKPVLPPARFK